MGQNIGSTYYRVEYSSSDSRGTIGQNGAENWATDHIFEILTENINCLKNFLNYSLKMQ